MLLLCLIRQQQNLRNLYLVSALNKIPFIYQDKQYSGHIMSSTNREPHFHWLIFDRAELYNLTGEDSVGFQVIDGNLVCTSVTLTYKHPQLVEVARKIIEKDLASI